MSGPTPPKPAAEKPEIKETGTKTKIPVGLNLSKSQKKKERARERKRKERAAKVESEALDTSTEDKLSQRMLNWINSSAKQGGKKLEESSLVEYTGDSEESGDSDSVDNAIENEKDSFHKKALEDSSKNSFFEDNPFLLHSTNTYKSVFANRLSLTPRYPKLTSSTASTPKRNRSPSPDLVLGFKSVRKQ